MLVPASYSIPAVQPLIQSQFIVLWELDAAVPINQLILRLILRLYRKVCYYYFIKTAD